MKIMITNDDGIAAPGIRALVQAFAAAGYEVVVCAPDSQRSAASHSLSIHGQIAIEEADFPGAAKAYAIGGTPADCVKLGLMRLSPDCEAVVSGINAGYNVGTDILYSGTVGAAMEGAICGRPALAVSQHHERADYAKAAALAVRLFERMMENPLGELNILNVNYPNCEEILGVAPAIMGRLHYDEEYVPVIREGVEKGASLQGKISARHVQSDDYEKLCAGYATYTVLKADMNDRAQTEGFVP